MCLAYTDVDGGLLHTKTMQFGGGSGSRRPGAATGTPPPQQYQSTPTPSYDVDTSYDAAPAAGAGGNNSSSVQFRTSTVVAGGGSSEARLEVERLRQDLALQRRDAQRQIEELQLDKSRLEAEVAMLRGSSSNLQSSIDSMTQQRNQDSRMRTEVARQVEDLRSENARLRRELATALDTRLSHLRTPMVSFEQYRALLAVTEQLATTLQNNGQLTIEGDGNPIAGAREWVEKMATLPGAGVSPTAESPASAMPPTAHRSTLSGTFNDSKIMHSREQSTADLRATPGPNVPALRLGGVTPEASNARGGGGSEQRQLSARQSQSQQAAQHKQQQRAPQEATLREPIVDGGKLFKIVRDAHPHSGKAWSFHNATSDSQFVLEFTFGPQSDVVSLGDTTVEGRTFRISLYPGETKDFMRGTPNGYRMAVKYGPPDEGYVPSSSVTDAELMPVVERVRSLGAGNPDDVLRLCVAQGIQFVDADFPPLSRSMTRPGEGSGPVVRWERPTSIVAPGEKPELAVSGFDAGGPTRGNLDDPWIASAMAVLATRRVDIIRAFAQSLPAEQLSGMYRVVLCIGGWWRSISVDSYLPCMPKTPTPFGAQCKASRDMWAPLMEKAFAKVHGSYVALAHGDPLEALIDISGGVVERVEWRAKDGSGFAQLSANVREHKDSISVVVTATEQGNAQAAQASAQPKTGLTPAQAAREAAMPTERRCETIGFKSGHAFVVLGCVHVEDFRLCLIANPEGAHDWTGAWSESSELWIRHPAVKTACNAVTANVPNIAGAVWLEWRDVLFYFAGAATLRRRPEWLDVRVANRFFGVKPLWSFELSVTKPTSIIFGVHQRDRRGLDNEDPDRTYSAFLITVVACSDAGVWDAVAQSHGGTFWRGRDVQLTYKLEPRDRAYYVIPRRYSAEGTKDVTVSMRVEYPKHVTAELKQPTDEVMNSVRYSPVWKFDPVACPSVAPPAVQIDREETGALAW